MCRVLLSLSFSPSVLLDEEFVFLSVSSAASSESNVLRDVCDVTYRRTFRAFRSP